MKTLMLRMCVLIISIVTLSACQSIPQNEGSPAKVSEVVAQIKQDIGQYQLYDAATAGTPRAANKCRGLIGFYIESVKVSLTVQTDNTASGTASATLPVKPAGAFGPSLGISRETKGKQTLTFILYPEKKELSPKSTWVLPPTDASRYPITANLRNLRESLLQASGVPPCVSLVPLKGNDKGGTFEFGFIVINRGTAGGTLRFEVFSLGATTTAERQVGNTITVTYKAWVDKSSSYTAAIAQGTLWKIKLSG